jgi:hypothetical protein
VAKPQPLRTPSVEMDSDSIMAVNRSDQQATRMHLPHPRTVEEMIDVRIQDTTLWMGEIH